MSAVRDRDQIDVAGRVCVKVPDLDVALTRHRERGSSNLILRLVRQHGDGNAGRPPRLVTELRYEGSSDASSSLARRLTLDPVVVLASFSEWHYSIESSVSAKNSPFVINVSDGELLTRSIDCSR